jgi:hypothetical protein
MGYAPRLRFGLSIVCVRAEYSKFRSDPDFRTKALALVEQAVEEERIDEAQRPATLAVEAARKSKNAALMRQGTAISQQIQAMQKMKNNKE